MMRAAGMALALACLLSGCAGQAIYSVHPFYDKDAKQFVCCQADVQNSKDIGAVTVHVTKTGDNYVFDLQETGVGATAPITAQSKAVSDVSAAVTNAAATAAQFIPK
ncbi:hypothetical protein GN109_06065 [Collimonas pratensis]|uniref:hypothetical protein n=1 Tax=Collimonas pratensis TaxID=279113 RepID=UPI00143CCCC4|nr:hypothetical protein [Collimonas pratensis]NKI68979.1 hypothetical protein [Collimonas pratensis]